MPETTTPELPSVVDQLPAESKPKPKPKSKPKAKPKPTPIWKKPGIDDMRGTVMLEIPIAILSGEFIPRRVRTDVRDITDKQRLGLRLMMQGLRETEEPIVLEGGEEIDIDTALSTMAPKVIRYLLESVVDAAIESKQLKISAKSKK